MGGAYEKMSRSEFVDRGNQGVGGQEVKFIGNQPNVAVVLPCGPRQSVGDQVGHQDVAHQLGEARRDTTHQVHAHQHAPL